MLRICPHVNAPHPARPTAQPGHAAAGQQQGKSSRQPPAGVKTVSGKTAQQRTPSPLSSMAHSCGAGLFPISHPPPAGRRYWKQGRPGGGRGWGSRPRGGSQQHATTLLTLGKPPTRFYGDWAGSPELGPERTSQDVNARPRAPQLGPTQQHRPETQGPSKPHANS